MPSPEIFVIRPYRPEDKEELYRTCLETGDGGKDATDLYTNYPNLLGDRSEEGELVCGGGLRERCGGWAKGK